jgi:hypothetical protein
MNIPSFFLAGVLAAGFALTAGQASGAVIYSGPMNVSIPESFEGIYIDVDGMTTGNDTLPGWDFNPFFGGSVIAVSASFRPVADAPTSTAVIERLDYDEEVNGSRIFLVGPGGSSEHMGPGPTQFVEGVESYFGFAFVPNGGSETYYGWVSLEVTANNPGGRVTGWAYENTGAPIRVGAVPEPASVLLLGLLPLMAWRRRRAC